MAAISSTTRAIVETLLHQKKNRVERGFYWENQIAFAYNSEKMEGNPLTKDQTRSIFETRTVTGRAIPADSVQEMRNHFRLFDYMLETIEEPLTKELLCDYHRILKTGTADDLENDDFVVGGWKTIPNAVANIQTTRPADVDYEMDRLLSAYHEKANKTYRDMAGFHVFFERIHPFQDGNGRIGRIVLFKECCAHDLEPFIVLDEDKARYFSGLSRFDEQPEALIEFFEDMRDLYFKEFSCLVPQNYLLPRFESFTKQVNLSPEGFFGKE